MLFFSLLFSNLPIYTIIDPRNKAFGLNYTNPSRPEYSLHSLETMNTPEKIEADKNNMIDILNRWKQKQGEDKPMMVVFNFGDGGKKRRFSNEHFAATG